nr:hypothetical protein [Sulfurisphaera tokodaii]
MKRKNKNMTIKEIEPWGVNVPYIYLSTIMFLLGGISLIKFPFYHPYFMMIGAYSLYFGMIQRLFFPAKNYLPLHILALILLAIPISHYFQFLASIVLVITEIKALKDVKSYGSKFPVSTLVLSSPFLSAILWYFYINYWSLIIPLAVYILGVNIGVFTATLGVKPFFGLYQIPVLILLIISMFLPFFLAIALVYYFAFLMRKGIKRINWTSISVILVSLASMSALYLGDLSHAFFLDVMFPLFFSCITYSTARYNHEKVVYIIPLLLFAFFTRFINLQFSAIFLPIAYIYFLYLIKDTLGITGIKLGISKKYL